MSILSAIRQQSSSIDDLAKLPQTVIMQMAQRKQIAPEMVAPILSRKAEMIDAAVKTKAMQQGAPQTSVMEQILAKNAESEEPMIRENTGIAQIPVPEPKYAGGGIIAFAKGDLVDDDYEIDPYDDYAKAFAAIQRANAMPVASKQSRSGLSQMLPQSYEAALAEKGETPASIRKAAIEGTKNAPAPERTRGSHKYEDMVIREAERLGVDPKLALHVLYKETGNLKNPETAKSSAGAIGVMQLMPKTAKGLGVDPLNPEENIRGGVTYLKQMYDKYQDPTLALAAYNAGPGRVDRILKSGQGINALPRETQNYIRMAEGGEVKHFQYGGSTMGGFELENYPADESVMSEEYKKYFKEYQKELENRMKSKKNLPPELQAPDLKTDISKKTSDEGKTPSVDSKLPAVPAAKPAPEEAAVKSPFEMFLEQNAADREALKKQSAEDRSMALLAAGLGIMGGESPYAAANIGKGALSGVSYLSQANRQRAAEQAALDKARISAMHYQNLGDYYKSGVVNKEQRLADQQYERSMAEITKINSDIENAAKNNVALMKGIDTITDPAKLEMLVQRERARLQAIAQPRLASLYKRAGIEMPDFSPTPAATVSGYKLVK